MNRHIGNGSEAIASGILEIHTQKHFLTSCTNYWVGISGTISGGADSLFQTKKNDI